MARTVRACRSEGCSPTNAVTVAAPTSKINPYPAVSWTPPGLLPIVPTSQVPINLTTGTSNDTNEFYTADWSQLVIGMHVFNIQLLQERFLVSHAFLADLRPRCRSMPTAAHQHSARRINLVVAAVMAHARACELATDAAPVIYDSGHA
jgi:hypothetical protein